MDYKSYLQSADWQKVRLLCFQHEGFKCSSCGFRESLECHHLTYKRLFKERRTDVLCLCGDCHQRVESFISSGMLSREGNTSDLRRKTLSVLSPCRGGDGVRINTKSTAIYSPKGNPLAALIERQKEFQKRINKHRDDRKALVASERSMRIRARKYLKLWRKTHRNDSMPPDYLKMLRGLAPIPI